MTNPYPISIARPDFLLRSEALVSLIASCAAYADLYPKHWGLFALLFFAPDIALLGYLAGDNRLTAAFYNALHNYAFPLTLGLFAWHFHWSLALQIALIWLSHVSFDRLLGYGLKFPGVFRQTHIQRAASI